MPAYLYSSRRFQGDGCRHSHHRYRGPLTADRETLYVPVPPFAKIRGRWKEDFFVEFCEEHGIDLVIAYGGLKRVDGNTESDVPGVLLQFHTETDALLFKLSYTR